MKPNIEKGLQRIAQDKRSQILLSCLGPTLFAVGGAVRDSLLQREISDIDYATPLHPMEVTSILESKGFKVIPTGLSHQTVTAIVTDKSHPVEITSFRNKEMKPEGGVFLGSSIEEDLSFRDFTCNALALNIQTSELIDVVGAVSDINARLLRAIPEADARFSEDPLRLLRMVRLASQLEFEIDAATLNSANKNFPLISSVAIERIREEFSKTLISLNPVLGLELLRKLGFYKLFLPELDQCIGFEQNKFHSKDVYFHTLDVIERTEPKLINRLAALLHDIGKPPSLSIGSEGERHFYLHEKIGADMVSPILKRLAYSNSTIKAVQQLTLTHMRPLNAGAGGLRRILRDTEPHYDEWRDLKQADTVAVLGDSEQLRLEFLDFDQRISKIKESPSGSIYKNLAVNGNDLKDLGLKEGPIYKEILKFCQEIVLDEPQKNVKTDLINEIKVRFLA